MNRTFRTISALALTLVAAACGGEPMDSDDMEDSALELDTNEAASAEASLAGTPNLKARIVNDGIYCAQSTVRWQIYNAGTASAGSSSASIQFDDDPPILRGVPALGVGQSSPIVTTFIPAQPDGDVVFRVTADVTHKITESSESDNMRGGYCD